MAQSYSRYQKRLTVPLWYERLLALILLVNYGLVIFNLTYIPLRDFWLQGRVQFNIKVGPFEQEFPKPPIRILPFDITPYYDWVKGIEPYRSTTAYLELVDRFTAAINQKALAGVMSPTGSTTDSPPRQTGQQTSPPAPETSHPSPVEQDQDIEAMLAELRRDSVAMIQENPFQIANKTGTLERIKNIMRAHVFDTRDASATDAFETFWSKDYLLTQGISDQLQFFNQQIRPLIATNYYRGIGENGQPTDNFPILDFPFFVIFLTDFLVRTRIISRRYKGISWIDAMFWRWYDFFLFIPAFRWLRIIPLMVRWDQARLLDLKTVKGQAVQGFVAIIAEEMTEVIVVRIVDQLQELVHQGQIETFLNNAKTRDYIDINNRNELLEISRIFLQVLVEKVLPKLQPEVQEFILYNLQSALKENVGYQQLQRLPGMKTLQTDMMRGMIDNTYQQSLMILQGLLQSDPEFDRLLEKIIVKLTGNLNSELKQKNNLAEVESLLVDFLEEFKINYIEKLSSADIDRILDETRVLRQRR
ncbi:MAG: hypothetical protein RLZZ490_1585 [Cyanobacteriota bacterium]